MTAALSFERFAREHAARTHGEDDVRRSAGLPAACSGDM
jgi:hypothetical protein